MSQSSIIIHKGGKEEKYEIYVEDYVLSFLKEETGTLELSEFYFYGFKENFGRKYTIYGVGRDRHLAVFDKYSLLDEIGCRLTQAGPVFLVREGAENYEIKGYEVFYQDNAQMQTYLIERNGEKASRGKEHDSVESEKCTEADRIKERGASSAALGSKYDADRRKKGAASTAVVPGRAPYRAISLQLSIMLVMLTAIMINSANSYDKMQQLNQSAKEVFFAMENQEAERAGQESGEGEIVARRDPSQEDLLKLAALEGPRQTEGDGAGDQAVSDETPAQDTSGDDTGETADGMQSQKTSGDDTGENVDGTQTRKVSDSNMEAPVTATESKSGETPSQETEMPQPENGGESDDRKENGEELEALSRNVARYYKVERGDTLYTISQKIYGDTTHVQKICEVNQITDPDRIRYGQKIILP